MLDETVSVIVASADCPGDSTVPCLSQLNVKYWLADVGFQLLACMPRVSEVESPVFLTQTVAVAVPPGDIAPQFKFSIGIVQALSEYTFSPGEDSEGEISILKLDPLELDVELEEPVVAELEE